MYRIYKANIYSANPNGATLIGSPTVKGLEILSGTMDLEVNEAGSFTFTISKNHSFYRTLKKRVDLISVYIGNSSTGNHFRIVNIERDFCGNEIITCEGMLTILRDYMCFPYRVDIDGNRILTGTFSGQVSSRTLSFYNLVSWILDSSIGYQSNLASYQAGASISEDVQTESLARESDGSRTVSEEMRDITDTFGGCVSLSQCSVESNGVAIFTRYSQNGIPGQTRQTAIEYGKNLLDITIEENIDDVYTSCLAVGDPVEGASEDSNWGFAQRVTAEGRQGAGNYLVDTDAYYINKYGKRVIFKEFEGLTTSLQVYYAARWYLRNLRNEGITIFIKAVDLSSVAGNAPDFTCGDMVPIVSEPHGINSTYLCSQAHIDLTDATQTYYVFGKRFTSASSLIAYNYK